MVSTRIWISGKRSLICRVGSNPFVPGIAMSIRIRLGRSDVASAMASSPFKASPATSISGSASRSSLTPARTMVWSSVIKTRILSVTGRLAERNGNPEPGAGPGLGNNLKRAAPLRHSFLHAEQPQAARVLAVRMDHRRVKALTIVHDFPAEQAVAPGQHDAHPLGGGMPHHVAQTFLKCPEQRSLDFRWQPLRQILRFKFELN